MHREQTDEAHEATENDNIVLLKKGFAQDVKKRAVENIEAKIPCVCGQYLYFSQKCGHVYKKVHLKCGKSTSKKTGKIVLCAAGRLRQVHVEDAKVPVNCKKCVNSSNRWRTEEVLENERRVQGEAERRFKEEKERRVKRADKDRSASPARRDRKRGTERERERPENPRDLGSQIPNSDMNAGPSLYNSLPVRARDKENAKAGSKGFKGSD
ncbi:uncharacterized protein F4807DRAFT_438334 [Annulohypoxylon truncatum]|uniref:uncharacterized protein n=1 Tax=Annulohypoxylon truncatum TaxID=327061 RepID=UPI002007C623|nr:uncharacterized protein F4807DRAFT_438334 [Annulohypoxylon truncatum]KAI1206531.1 hypothetical protein F4807DRAFT_438334 [Annulohypoxylon truncatum]